MTKNIVIVDYGMGNVRSVVNAFEYLGAKPIVSGDPKRLAYADGIVVPGQGAVRDCMANLVRHDLVKALHEQVIDQKKPYLGICLGMQVLGEVSFEGGEFACLGWIKGSVKKIQPQGLKVPHLGWNDIRVTRDSPLFVDLPTPACFYFAHSYVLHPDDTTVVTATTDYGGEFSVALQKDNILAVQFHPEKSQKDGLQLLRNFVKLV